MQSVFLHGLESGPVGRKSEALLELDPTVIVPDLRAWPSAALRAPHVAAALPTDRPLLLVGSSLGGLSAVLLENAGTHDIRGMVLCAPALLRAEAPLQPARCPVITLHGRQDEALDFDATVACARALGHEVHAVDDDHRLSASLDAILDAWRSLRARLTAPT
jgi:alpha-beta hydrolase superfamily lysophospholipase